MAYTDTAARACLHACSHAQIRASTRPHTWARMSEIGLRARGEAPAPATRVQENSRPAAFKSWAGPEDTYASYPRSDYESRPFSIREPACGRASSAVKPRPNPIARASNAPSSHVHVSASPQSQRLVQQVLHAKMSDVLK